jgi:N-acetylglucosamine-6-sulfatase
MIIRGPGVREKARSELVTSHVDLVPTILKMIGEKPRPDFDGSWFTVTTEQLSGMEKRWQKHVGVEYWGPAVRS